MIHPNAEQQSDASAQRAKDGGYHRAHTTFSKHHRGGCGKYIKRFDEAIMKPIFIYKYHKFMSKQADEFYNVFLEEGLKLEEMYEKAGVEKKRTSVAPSAGYNAPAPLSPVKNKALLAQ